MSFASGNTGRIEFQRDPDDSSDGLDLALTHFNVVAWRFTEDTTEFKSVTPYPKVTTIPGDEVRAPGRNKWQCFVRFLVRTSAPMGGLSDLPARFKVWSTLDQGLGINFREGYGYATDIVTIGDRRGVVTVEAMVRSAWGGLVKVL